MLAIVPEQLLVGAGKPFKSSGGAAGLPALNDLEAVRLQEPTQPQQHIHLVAKVKIEPRAGDASGSRDLLHPQFGLCLAVAQQFSDRGQNPPLHCGAPVSGIGGPSGG